jgi:hypothetical protein
MSSERGPHLGARLRRFAAGAVLSVLLLGVGASVAAAGESRTYCGKLIQHGSYCQEGASDNHSWNYNAAYYYGGGNQYMCERAIDADRNPYTYGPSATYRCAYLNGSGQFGVDSGRDIAYNCSPQALLDVFVRNLSGNQHTVWGGAKYGTGQGYPC